MELRFHSFLCLSPDCTSPSKWSRGKKNRGLLASSIQPLVHLWFNLPRASVAQIPHCHFFIEILFPVSNQPFLQLFLLERWLLSYLWRKMYMCWGARGWLWVCVCFQWNSSYCWLLLFHFEESFTFHFHSGTDVVTGDLRRTWLIYTQVVQYLFICLPH